MANAEHTITVPAELDNAIVVRLGDKLLVVGTPNRLNFDQADTIKQMLAAKLPGVEIVIVSECSGLAVYHREETPEPAPTPNADLVPGADEMLRSIGRRP